MIHAVLVAPRHQRSQGFVVNSEILQRFLRVFVCLGVCACRVDAKLPKRFLIVSSPTTGAILYASLPRGGGLREGAKMHELIKDTDGVQEPMGIAVDQLRSRLFIADVGLQQIISYQLDHGTDPTYLGVSSPKVHVNNADVRWLAVDNTGNLFYTIEATNQIFRLTFQEQKKSDPKPEAIYNGSIVPRVSMPGGIVVDDYRLYWVNKQLATSTGSVVRAPKVPPADGVDPSSLTEPLAWNTDKSYGLCAAMKNVFYTQPDTSIFSVLKTGDGLGGYGTVTNRLAQPRGCVFDGDGTIYVADRGASAVYSFAGNMQTLGGASITKTATVQDAFGVAVFSGARRSVGIFATVVWVASMALQ
eukprot:TRINITY_DN3557_c0_g1_i1.p1 TRINITY_DN3557_c0_g1~~TRINITY_DN3557_c0_g1_i1.p1  ORF type:complete len:394 (+),score=55.51 TRINITY_DN3557_c0_g1_i1:108-1184(+)